MDLLSDALTQGITPAIVVAIYLIAVKVIDNVAKIDYNKCTECGLCAQKCPTKVIKEFIN